MHRDKKVGLALAILLCSIVGAFFFRDEAPRKTEPALTKAEELDRAITQGSNGGRVPYSEADGKSRGNDARRSRSAFDQSDLPPFLRDDPAGGNSTTQRNRVNGSRDPFANGGRAGNSSDVTTLTPPPQDAPAMARPLENADWDIVSNDSPTARRNGTDVAPAMGQKRMHVVAVGDTLSSIAGKYLGSQTRYQEIFQANHDQLKSADDLKIGMKLTIPDRTETRSASSTNAGRSASDKAVKTQRPTTSNSSSKFTERTPEAVEPADSTKSKVKFKPAKTGPAIRRTTDASEEESLGKTLSQVPPRNLLEVDDGLLAELERDFADDKAAPRVAQAARTDGSADNNSSKSE